jgi:electron transfer flavoprotein beta subunit
MEIIVLLKQVPDLVEELALSEDGKSLDSAWLRHVLSEYDDHALEQALLLKERHGGGVHVLALDRGDVDESLYQASAKGADSVEKILPPDTERIGSHRAAALYRDALAGRAFDLVLTGVQAIDDLDGQVGPALASLLGLPYVGVVRGVDTAQEPGRAVIKKEYPGGTLAEMSVALPAVLGIQAATQPPRYVPVARLRQAMKGTSIATRESGDAPAGATPRELDVTELFKPVVAEHAEILEGDLNAVVEKIHSILVEQGLMR